MKVKLLVLSNVGSVTLYECMVLKVVFIYLFIIGAVLEGSRLFNIFHLILIIQTGWVIMKKGELGWKSPFWVPSEKKIIIIPLDWVVSWIGSHNNEMYRWTVGHCIVAVFRENYFRLGKTICGLDCFITILQAFDLVYS